MDFKWHKLLIKLAIWLSLEIVLNVMGLDDMADYSEFIFKLSNSAIASTPIEIIKI